MKLWPIAFLALVGVAACAGAPTPPRAAAHVRRPETIAHVKTDIYLTSQRGGYVPFLPDVGSRRVGYVLYLPDSTDWRLGADTCDLSVGDPGNGGPEQLVGRESIGPFSDLLIRRSETHWSYYLLDDNERPARASTGRAVRLGPNRWDVYKLNKRIGSVRGRDGPAAALALLMTWPSIVRCLA